MNQWCDPVNNTYVLNFLGTKGYEILPRYKLGGRVRVFFGVWWGEMENDKGTRESGENCNECHRLPHQPQRSATLPPQFPSTAGAATTATRRKPSIWLCPSGHFYNVGWAALENPILSPTAIWPQVVISNKACLRWFLWTQTKAATTFFFLPQIFQTNCSCYVGLFVSKATAYI